MAENPLLFVLYGLFDLLKGSFLVSIIVFVFVFIAIFVRTALAKKYKLNWFKSSILTTYFLVFSLVLVLYIMPVIDILITPATGIILPELQPTPVELLIPFVLQFARLLVIALMLTLLLMPLEFIGIFLFEKISEKFKFAYSIRLFLTVFAVSVFTSAFVLFVAPWSIAGILFLIYFGFE